MITKTSQSSWALGRAKRARAIGVMSVLISVFLQVACSFGFDQKKFENVNRAAMAIEAATSVGVNHQKFSELVQALGTELLVVKDKIGNNEQELDLIGAYNAAYRHYARSQEVWSGKLKTSPYGDGRLLTSERDDIVSVYGVSTQPYEEFLSYDPDEAIPIIWAAGSVALARASALYNRR